MNKTKKTLAKIGLTAAIVGAAIAYSPSVNAQNQNRGFYSPVGSEVTVGDVVGQDMPNERALPTKVSQTYNAINNFPAGVHFYTGCTDVNRNRKLDVGELTNHNLQSYDPSSMKSFKVFFYDPQFGKSSPGKFSIIEKKSGKEVHSAVTTIGKSGDMSQKIPWPAVRDLKIGEQYEVVFSNFKNHPERVYRNSFVVDDENFSNRTPLEEQVYQPEVSSNPRGDKPSEAPVYQGSLESIVQTGEQAEIPEGIFAYNKWVDGFNGEKDGKPEASEFIGMEKAEIPSLEKLTIGLNFAKFPQGEPMKVKMYDVSNPQKIVAEKEMSNSDTGFQELGFERGTVTPGTYVVTAEFPDIGVVETGFVKVK